MHRLTIVIMFAACFALTLAGSRAAAASGGPPNILLIVTDDQGIGDSSSYYAKDLQTPHFDALAKSGVLFNRFRVNPLCAPTRASIMSGQSSLETGMWRGPSQKEEVDRALHADLKLAPQFLKQAGYATGLFGKWHLGYASPNVPNERGFDEFVGFLGGAHPYEAGRNSRIVKNGEPYPTNKHMTDLFADEAADFIRRQAAAKKPFFCYVAFNAVHGPLRNEDRAADSGKPDWLAKYEAMGVPQPRRDYCAIMGHADQRMGDLLAVLRELGIDQNTLIICVSDNGAQMDKYAGSNGPLRGEKGLTYEGGIRVPAAMAWPAVIPAGAVSEADAAHFDLFATMLEAAGIDRPQRNGKHPVHGVSLISHAKSGGKQPLPDRYLFWDLWGQMGALHGQWKLVGAIENHHGKWDQALAAIESHQFELYDLATDPGEQKNIAQQHPEITSEMKQRYIAWMREATK